MIRKRALHAGNAMVQVQLGVFAILWVDVS